VELGHQTLRCREDTLPNYISSVRNVVTPMESGIIPSKQPVREAESFSGSRMLPKAKATSRKAWGIHNPVDKTDI
ncbi:MAG: hypothetical protein ICV63_02685, partial [Coleofasciculus sp. Co-bin14]|nr:hypothetical protein [Coleofasciculus sp. Co-bin14]